MSHPPASANFHILQWFMDRDHRAIIGCMMLSLSLAACLMLKHALLG